MTYRTLYSISMKHDQAILVVNKEQLPAVEARQQVKVTIEWVDQNLETS